MYSRDFFFPLKPFRDYSLCSVYILHPACVLLSVCSLHFTVSLHFTPGFQSAVRIPQLLSPQSAVRCPQSAVHSLQSAVRSPPITLTAFEILVAATTNGFIFQLNRFI